MNDIERLARLTRTESSTAGALPTGEFIDRVLADIRFASPPAAADRTWAVAASSAVVIAIVAIGLAAGQWSSLFNPLSSFGDTGAFVTELQ